MIFERIDHIGVAVWNLDEALAEYRRLGEPALGKREPVPAFGLEALMIASGEAAIELIQPTSPDSTVRKFLEKRGPGLHHVAYRVADVEAALERCRAAGLQLIDERPREGYAGSRVAFIHPKSMGGILTELVEREAGRDRPPYDPA